MLNSALVDFSCAWIRKLRMADTSSNADSQPKTGPAAEVDAALLDAELFIKYNSPERAIKRLKTALERNPRSIPLRERLREIAAAHKHAEEAARQGLALASLYVEREDFDNAYDRLLEAKQLDPRINVAKGLESIRNARRPDLKQAAVTVAAEPKKDYVTFAGDLAAVSLFDAIQVVENAKLTGALILSSEAQSGRVLFNEGRIVDAEAAGSKGNLAFRHIVEITSGSFQFEKSPHEFPVVLSAISNTNLLLDTLQHLDEAKA
jgi:tetratricopeptide (TPR) repeat protein